MNPIKILGVLLFLSSVMACKSDFKSLNTQPSSFVTVQRPSVTPEDSIKILLISMLQAIENKLMGINDTCEFYSMTALHCAAFLGNKETVIKLLALRANSDTADKFGSTPLHLAAKAGGNEEVVKVLLEDSQTDVSKRNNKGLTALDYAIRNDHKTIIELLGSRENKQTGVTYSAEVQATIGELKALKAWRTHENGDTDRLVELFDNLSIDLRDVLGPQTALFGTTALPARIKSIQPAEQIREFLQKR